MTHQLETTDTQLHALETILDNTRKSSTQAAFPVAAIRALVRDHITLCTVVRERKQISISKTDMESMR